VPSCKLTAWAEMLAFNDHPARRWEPERLGLLLFSIAARITSHALANLLRFSDTHPWRTCSP
jgi:hypothetical protein